jgi:predicted DNA-binding transcriptional regulator AlpA
MILLLMVLWFAAKLVGPEGLSEHLGGIPVSTLYRWVSRGEQLGPLAHKVGRHLRWDLAEVDAHMKAQRDGAGNVAPLDHTNRERRVRAS